METIDSRLNTSTQTGSPGSSGLVSSADSASLVNPTANDIRICDKCRHIRVKSMLSKLQQAAPDTEVKVGCKSYCGPCSRYAFIFVNGRYVTAPTEDEAIEKARRFIK